MRRSRSRACSPRPTPRPRSGASPGSPRCAASATSTPRNIATLLESDAVPIRPERICGELSRHVPDDAIVVVDTGHAGMWMGGMFDLKSARQDYLRSAGHLGWAFPAGLGAKCACPDRPVVTFTGDAGFWYHIAEIETAVRWSINAVTDRQQQRRRQPVEARLRPRLWRRADRAGARVVDLQSDEFRAARRGHGRARAARREGGGFRAGARARARSEPAGGDRRGDRHRGAGAKPPLQAKRAAAPLGS